MVEPEVGEHLLQLPLAVHGAEQFLRLERFEHLLVLALKPQLFGCDGGLLEHGDRFVGTRQRHRRDGQQVPPQIRKCRPAAGQLLRIGELLAGGHHRRGVIRGERTGAECEGGERREPRLKGLVRDGLRMELFLEVRAKTHQLDALDAAGPRPKRRAVQHVGGGSLVYR